MKRRGFTLIEIAIVLAVIGILLMIAVPQFIRSRAHSQSRSCVSSLKKIAEAKEQWGMSTNQPANAACKMDDLVPDFIKRLPECPTAGQYTPGGLNEAPTCTFGTMARFAHKL